MITIPSKLVLDYISRQCSYDTETGIISKAGKRLGCKKDNYIIIHLVLDTTYEGCSLHYSAYAHQVAWFLFNESWPDKMIDHINGDRQDNRIVNLRLVDSNQNARNRRKLTKPTTSQYKGVYRRGDKYRAYIYLNGKVVSLGTYSTEKEAALAYNAKALESFQDYSCLNDV